MVMVSVGGGGGALLKVHDMLVHGGGVSGGDGDD